MPDTEPFPWDLLKAECLRLVCSQLVQGSQEGGHYPGLGRKEEMITFLRDVEALGLEPAIKKIDTTTTPRKTSTGSENPESAKRKSSRLEGSEEEGESSDLTHNTRYKGAKRVKLTKDDKETSASANPTPRKRGPGRPRKSTEGASADGVKRGRGRPRKSDATSKDNTKDDGDAADSSSTKKARGRPKTAPPTDENGVLIKRGRGRPRKNASGGESASAAAAAPSSKGKSVFDGVILNKRRPSVQGETSAEGQAAEQSEVKQGDAAEEDVVLAVINGQGMADASSLGGSIQANDPNNVNIGDDHDADADADGDPDPQVASTA